MSLATNTGPLIERSKRETLLQAPGMIERTLRSASSALEEAQRSSRSVARRMQLDDALAALERHAATLRGEFPRRLLAGIEADLQAAPQGVAARKSSGESVLALLDEGEVSRFVEASRLQQNAMPLVERTLGQLDSLMSSALGLPVVRADRNPFRPEILCGALMEALQDLPEGDEIRSLWVRHLSTPFAGEMRTLYESLVAMLEAQGVEEARYRVRLAAGGAAPRGAAGSATDAGGEPGTAAPAAGGAGAGWSDAGMAGAGARSPWRPASGPSAHGAQPGGRGFVARVDELSRSAPAMEAAVAHDFLYRAEWFEPYDEPLPAGYYQAVEAEQARLAAQPEAPWDDSLRASELEALQAQDVVDRAPRAVRIDAALAPAQWGELASSQARTRARMALKARAQRISQVLGLDAVRLLIEQIAGDGRVLAPVREAFVALEPALLRLALDQPRFFAEEAHPARALMEAVAQRSFKYNDEFAPEFEQFMAPLRAAVRKLVQAPDVTGSDFEGERLALEKGWKAADESGESARARALGSMQFAQERQALADRIALDFSLRPDLVGVPMAVADFLYRDWSLVIAHAQLTRHDAGGSRLDPGGYLAVVSDLLWSVNSEQAIRQPARLFEVVPDMLGTLRRGLEMLGKEPAETSSFFDVLMRYHEPVLRLRRFRSAQDAEASGHGRASAMLEGLPSGRGEVLTERPVPRKAEQPWLAREERAAAGFADTEHPEDSAAPGIDTGGATGAADLPHPEESTSGPSTLGPGVDPALRPAGAAPAPAAVDAADLAARIRTEVARMRTGDWVDLYVRKSWRRAQLSWTSDNGSLFMFVSQGGSAHGMTRRTCERLLRQRHLRPVDMDPVVDRALRQMARQAAAGREAQVGGAA